MRRKWLLVVILGALAGSMLVAPVCGARQIVFRERAAGATVRVDAYFLSDDLPIDRVIATSNGFIAVTEVGRLLKVRLYAPKGLKTHLTETAIKTLMEMVLTLDPTQGIRALAGALADAAKDIVKDAAKAYVEGADKLFSYGEVPVHPTHTSGGRRITYGGETFTEGQGLPTRCATSIRLPASTKTVTATRIQSGYYIQPSRSTGRAMFTAFDQTAAR